MKVKWDFVTNSSSCCFLLSSEVEIRESDIIDLGTRPNAINAFHCLSSIETLISYTEGDENKPCDWVMKARGPVKYWGMQRQWYEKARQLIEEGNHIICVDIERNYDDVDNFEEALVKLGMHIIYQEYD